MNALTATCAVMGIATTGIASDWDERMAVTTPLYTTSGGTTAVPSWISYPVIDPAKLAELLKELEEKKQEAEQRAKLEAFLKSLPKAFTEPKQLATRKGILEDLRKLNNDL